METEILQLNCHHQIRMQVSMLSAFIGAMVLSIIHCHEPSSGSVAGFDATGTGIDAH